MFSATTIIDTDPGFYLMQHGSVSMINSRHKPYVWWWWWIV